MMKPKCIKLSPAQSQLLMELIKTGQYSSVDEALDECLLFSSYPDPDPLTPDELREHLALGVEQARNGDFMEGTGREAFQRTVQAAFDRVDRAKSGKA